MLQMLIGSVIGALAGYLYGSERGREEARRRFASAPEPVRRMTQTAASAAGTGAQRAAEALSSAPVPDQVKEVARRTGAAVQTAAQRTGQVASAGPGIVLPTETETATRPSEPLPTQHPQA